MIFKTEDGTPAGILNNRWWPGGKVEGGLSREEVEQAGFRKKGRRGEKEIADDVEEYSSATGVGGRERESDRQRGNWEIETEPALSDVGKKDAIRDTDR